MDIDTITQGIEQNLSTDAHLDYIKTIEWTNTISRISSLVLGILVILILILIPIVCSLELIYITMPSIRYGVQKQLDSNTTPGFVKKSIEFTLKDGVKAVEIANTTQQGTDSALVVYLKIKIKAIMIEIFLLVFIVVGGGGTALVQKAQQLFSGALNAIVGQ